MTYKHVLFQSAVREKILRGASQLAEAVRVTLGPRSKSVLIERRWGTPIVCNDGVTIAKEFELKDREEISSLGVYSDDLKIPLQPFAAGLGDYSIVTTLCPGGKERMDRLMNVVASARVDLRPLVTHRFKLDQIEKAYDLFSHQRDGVLKVAVTP